MLEKLEKLLKEHNWFHEQSESEKIWKEGRKELKEIESLLEKLDKPTAKELWNKWCPFEFRKL